MVAVMLHHDICNDLDNLSAMGYPRPVGAEPGVGSELRAFQYLRGEDTKLDASDWFSGKNYVIDGREFTCLSLPAPIIRKPSLQGKTW